MNTNAFFTTMVLATLLATASAASRSFVHQRHALQTYDGSCRGEPVCLDQGICTEGAYEYDIATAGKDFPYSVSYTTTASTYTTTFVFMVCSTANKMYGGCKSTDAGCSGLKAFQLRTRDDQLEAGRSLNSVPAGVEWASCDPYGPGHVWKDSDLGDLVNSPATADSCATFSVTLNSAATLADVCQQNVEIRDDMNSTIFAQPLSQASCLVVLETNAGRMAFGTVVDPAPVGSKATSSATPYGPMRRRLRGVNSRATIGRMF